MNSLLIWSSCSWWSSHKSYTCKAAIGKRSPIERKIIWKGIQFSNLKYMKGVGVCDVSGTYLPIKLWSAPSPGFLHCTIFLVLKILIKQLPSLVSNISFSFDIIDRNFSLLDKLSELLQRELCTERIHIFYHFPQFVRRSPMMKLYMYEFKNTLAFNFSISNPISNI